MAIYLDSRYQSATIVTEVNIERHTGKEINPVVFIDDDRKQWSASDFNDNIIHFPNKGDTPDMVAHQLYRNASLYWIVGDFNDFVAQNPFIVFNGTERLTMPSQESLFNTILSGEENP